MEEARELSGEADLGYTSRENIETCGSQEKKLKRAEEDNVDGPCSPEVPESVDEVILQEDASKLDMESAEEGVGHGASGGNTLEPDDVYNSNSDTCTKTRNPNEMGDSHIDSVEIVNLSLITIRSSKDGVSSVRREHNFATSTHYDPRSFDWRGFIRHMEEELCDHAEAFAKSVQQSLENYFRGEEVEFECGKVDMGGGSGVGTPGNIWLDPSPFLLLKMAVSALCLDFIILSNTGS
ncbi:Hypothetical predicted protein [Mytilus galloprovincialis]|uniref:Uncharacterized protein n=1 Tax=Mytilus galloprovincialis TaxID=29158 RepID=A0A8B6DWW8_MYTGA|nr:Hypothetical predicted protein [Mytilus galloprovincialis]